MNEADRDLLQTNLRRLFAEHGSASWPALVELGLADLDADPSVGAVAPLALAMEESGRAGVVAPLLPSLLASRLLDAERDADLLAAIRSGAARVCCAFDASDEEGVASLVEGAESSSHLLLVEPDPRVVIVDLGGPGVRIEARPGLARPDLCDVTFDTAAIRAIAAAPDAVRDVRHIARLALASRALGAATRSYELAVEHAQTRRQFGQVIGKFQALQHKLANALTDLDAVRLMLAHACESFDARHPDRTFFALAAFAFANPALRCVALEAQHVLGATGFAEEHEAPGLFRRVHADLVRIGGVRAARDDLATWLLPGDTARAIPPDDLGPAAEALRGEVRAWLSSLDGVGTRDSGFGWDPAFSVRLGTRGWIGTAWPKGCGGSEWSVLEQLTLIQELERSDAPTSCHLASERLIAPAIIAFGTPEQQARLLPSIRAGRLSICLGYSEPEAGSDLASLRTRAVRDGDDWIIDGQKLWTTGMEHAQYIWLAARTNPQASPPHAGISIFLVPLDLPGITRRPSTAFYGQPFTATTWEGVRVPGNALVGDVDGGWKVITHALAAERLIMGGHVVRIENLFRSLCAHVAADDSLRERLDVRSKIAERAAELEAARQLVLRTARILDAGRLPLHEAAMCKAYSAELMERLSEDALDLVGERALLGRESPGAPCDGRIEQMLRTSIMMVIGGGTNEIQRNLIAQRGVGLPR